MTGRLLRTGFALALGCATLGTSMTPTYAGDRGGAIVAGVIGGAALGALAAGAVGGAYAQPPRTVYVERAYAPPPPPPRCHREIIRHWDDFLDAYVERERRICEAY